MSGYPRRPNVSTNGGWYEPSSARASPRPRTPSENLHPHWRTPHTPPHSPNRPTSSGSLNRIYDLERENDDLHSRNQALVQQLQSLQEQNQEVESEKLHLKEKLDRWKHDLSAVDDERAEHATINKRNLELEKLIADDRAAIEHKSRRLAEIYIDLRQYAAAAQEYKELASRKEMESRERARLRDAEGACNAGDASILYSFEFGNALAQDDRHADAELAFRSVRNAKKRLNSTRAEAVDDRIVQIRLCKVLCLQGKTSEAKQMYLDAAQPLALDALDNRSQDTCTWVLRNAMGLAQILIKEADYHNAMYWLEKIWFHRHRASPEDLHNLETDMLEITTIVECRGESKQLSKLLHTICDDQKTTPLSEMAVGCMAKLGVMLYDSGEPKSRLPGSKRGEGHSKAFAYLLQAWDNRQDLDSSALRSTGWRIALVFLSQQMYAMAKDILRELNHSRIDDDSDTTTGTPTNDQILILLAHVQFKTGDLDAAKTNATQVFRRQGLKDVVSSSLVDSAKYHQANTLMLVLAEQGAKVQGTPPINPKFQEARDVWSRIYKGSQNVRNSNDKLLLLSHIEAAKVLARRWETYADQIERRPKSAEEMRKQIVKVERSVQ